MELLYSCHLGQDKAERVRKCRDREISLRMAIAKFKVCCYRVAHSLVSHIIDARDEIFGHCDACNVRWTYCEFWKSCEERANIEISLQRVGYANGLRELTTTRCNVCIIDHRVCVIGLIAN